jgi:hypothetical protein
MRVYYLSESTFALSNIALRRVKISRFAELNDPFELLGADLANRFEREAFRRTKEQIDGEVTRIVEEGSTFESRVLAIGGPFAGQQEAADLAIQGPRQGNEAPSVRSDVTGQGSGVGAVAADMQACERFAALCCLCGLTWGLAPPAS